MLIICNVCESDFTVKYVFNIITKPFFYSKAIICFSLFIPIKKLYLLSDSLNILKILDTCLPGN